MSGAKKKRRQRITVALDEDVVEWLERLSERASIDGRAAALRQAVTLLARSRNQCQVLGSAGEHPGSIPGASREHLPRSTGLVSDAGQSIPGASPEHLPRSTPGDGARLLAAPSLRDEEDEDDDHLAQQGRHEPEARRLLGRSAPAETIPEDVAEALAWVWDERLLAVRAGSAKRIHSRDRYLAAVLADLRGHPDRVAEALERKAASIAAGDAARRGALEARARHDAAAAARLEARDQVRAMSPKDRVDAASRFGLVALEAQLAKSDPPGVAVEQLAEALLADRARTRTPTRPRPTNAHEKAPSAALAALAERTRPTPPPNPPARSQGAKARRA